MLASLSLAFPFLVVMCPLSGYVMAVFSYAENVNTVLYCNDSVSIIIPIAWLSWNTVFEY